MLTSVTNNPIKEGIKQKSITKVGEQILQSLQRTNQIGHVKGVSKTHAGKSLLMTNSMDWYR